MCFLIINFKDSKYIQFLIKVDTVFDKERPITLTKYFMMKTPVLFLLILIFYLHITSDNYYYLQLKNSTKYCLKFNNLSYLAYLTRVST